ncbi:MAG: site-specific DNA-methyltransferase [Gammaproteobacteria bacterium]|nr:site-specific DNA-methyltransferase [Gammaproteobacteria bacterium]
MTPISSRDSLIADEAKTDIFGSANWNGTSLEGRPWGIYHGDAEDVLKQLPQESVNCVVTSPPYFWLRDYGVDGQIGLEENVDDYVNSIKKVMEQVFRLLKKDGVLFLNIGDTYYSGKGASQGRDRKSNKRRFGLRAVDKSGGLGIGLQRKSMIGIPWRVALEMSTSGWVLRSPIIWHRENRLPEHVLDRPSRSYEYVFMFVKSRRYYFDKQPLIDQKVEEDMWTIPAKTKHNGLDTAPYPEELVRRCLEIGCSPNGVVLDPFLGSGTTASVAIAMGHSAVGIELNQEFCEHAATQLGSL